MTIASPEPRCCDMRARYRRAAAKKMRKGAATVELAIALPLMLLFAFAATDLGRIVHAHVAVTNAARAGAMHGSMHSFTAFTRAHWETGIRESVIDEMSGLSGFNESKLGLTIETTTDDDDLFRAAVEVTYPFETVVSWPGLPSTVDIRYRCVMRQIR